MYFEAIFQGFIVDEMGIFSVMIVFHGDYKSRISELGCDLKVGLHFPRKSERIIQEYFRGPVFRFFTSSFLTVFVCEVVFLMIEVVFFRFGIYKIVVHAENGISPIFG